MFHELNIIFQQMQYKTHSTFKQPQRRQNVQFQIITYLNNDRHNSPE